jgi:hypothetical protein
MAQEPCLVCEEETATGCPLYVGRTEIVRDQARRYVCEDCRARSSPERRHELSRDERGRLHESAAVFGTWWSGGPGGGF